MTSAKAKVDTTFEKLPENLKEGSLISKETFRKFLDHKICVIKKEHREEEALKYLRNLTIEKPRETFMRTVSAVIVLSRTEVA